MIRLVALATTAFLLVPSSLLADSLLIVLNKSDHEAALVDPASYDVKGKLPTGKGPHEAAASPDGRLVYVSNYGSFAVFRDRPPERTPGNSITVIDLEKREVKASFDLGEYTMPHGIWVSRDGSRLWVTCEGAQAVLELEAATGKILKAWKTNQQTSHMVVPTPDERKLYVSNIGSGSVTVIDRSNDEMKTISTGAGAEGIDVSPDGGEVWVGNRGANTISIIATTTDTVKATFSSGGEVPIRVKFTPDGSQVWVSNACSNSITVFDAGSRQLLGRIETGAVPVGLLMTPDGSRVFVANTNANQVSVIDAAERKLLKSFATGTEPDGMAWAEK